MGLDPTHVMERQAAKRVTRRCCDAGAGGIGRGHAVAFAAHAESGHHGLWSGAPAAGMARTLEDENSGPLAKHRTGAAPIERPARRVSRIGASQYPRRVEAGEYLGVE